MTDQYAAWRAMLTPDGPPPLHLDEPCPGFYRVKRGKTWLPVAIWRQSDRDGDLCCVIDGREVNDTAMLEAWAYAYPIAHGTYIAVTERGEGWPDVDDTVAAQIGRRCGHNMPPPEDELTLLREQIEAAEAGAKQYATITDDVTAQRAQSLRARLLELGRTAEKRREAEKRPHFEAGKAVDIRWRPLFEAATAAANAIRKAISGWETAKLASEREVARIAAEAAAAEAARKAELAAVYAPAFAPPPATTPAPPSASVVKGGYGRAASVKLVKVVTGVTDHVLLYRFLALAPELRELMLKLAQRAVNSGQDVPGVSVEEQRIVS